ncbi:Dihydroorotate dehydrogenase superfamily [Synechococcus sp. PCC 7335]|uniref:dihydroorotate dehydrogenase-like protein n=1 Tax=Synechococcus sp. (strain ATCC 29403 / PCC 7335) TaxID=91464 RepID=UPI00017ECB42|nr:dihydroorotate dehydrogenase-like protein [Synechococcus sp. PCC 7335]EDX83983.1 Dihydroorotate dehydrogenase superfamily [Synechococcus sp. PCC 7335]
MDLATTYLGLTLKSPLVVGAAAPLSEELETLKRLEDAGAAAIVLHSVFEEQIHQDSLELNYHLEHGTHSFAESLTYFPEANFSHVEADHYLEHIRKAKESLAIPVIASLNGSSIGGWVDYARDMEQAGADAIELNIYDIPTDLDCTGAMVEEQYLEIVRWVKAQVDLPVAVKLSPFFSSTANMAKRLTEAGANGLVLFNRFYQPDIDIENLDVKPNLLLSSPHELRLPMHWIALLHGRIEVDLAATSGIQTAQDVVRLLMAGAKVTQLVSILLRRDVTYLGRIEQELSCWMEEYEYASVAQLQGTMSQLNCPNPSAFERVQYMKTLQTYHPDWKLREEAVESSEASRSFE